MTQMAPSEKPIDRARGGMPSDRAAKTPGPTMASVAEMAMLATMVSHSHGDRAKTAAKAADDQRGAGQEAHDQARVAHDQLGADTGRR